MRKTIRSFNFNRAWIGCLTLSLMGAMFGCQRSAQPVANQGPGDAAENKTVENIVENQAAVAPAQQKFPAQRANVNLCKLGAKLRDNNDAQKMITGIPGTLLDVKVGTVFDIQIPHALQLYKALEGRVPKNHAEFVSKILEPNQLKLPELIDGMVYRFNPEKEELWAYPDGEAPPEK